MSNVTTKIIAVGAISTLFTTGLLAGVPANLAYPKGELKSAEAVMENAYFVNHFYAFKNYSIEKNKRIITVIVKKSEGEKPLTDTVERYLNNDYQDDANVKAKDLAIFRSGKMKGTGMLITDFKDDARSQEYLAWLPALRKIRRFAQPAHDDAWGGTDFTFGDVTLRKPMHEAHELLGTETFGKTVHTMIIPENEQTNTTKNLPAGTDEYKSAQVYKIKSTTKFPSWWYDYRITYVDTKTFSDYLTEYYKGGKLVKTLEKNWRAIDGQTDPRALRWYTWYAKNVTTNHETMAFIPKEVTKFNTNLPNTLWSESTLTKIKK
jgi:hypothetical protein